MTIKLLLSGDGGQGIQLISDLICKSAYETNFHVSHIPNYGLEQRGGVSLAFIIISDQEISYPKFTKPDILVIMSDQARERTKQYQYEGVKIIDIKDLQEKLNKENVVKQSYNVFVLGMLVKILEEKVITTKEKVFDLLKVKLEKKQGWDENEKAFQISFQIQNQKSKFQKKGLLL